MYSSAERRIWHRTVCLSYQTIQLKTTHCPTKGESRRASAHAKTLLLAHSYGHGSCTDIGEARDVDNSGNRGMSVPRLTSLYAMLLKGIKIDPIDLYFQEPCFISTDNNL